MIVLDKDELIIMNVFVIEVRNHRSISYLRLMDVDFIS